MSTGVPTDLPKKPGFTLNTRLQIIRAWYKCNRTYTELHLKYRDVLPTESVLKEWDKQRNYIGRCCVAGIGDTNVMPEKSNCPPFCRINGETVCGKSLSKGRVRLLLPAPIHFASDVFLFWARPGNSEKYVDLEPWMDYDAVTIPRLEVPSSLQEQLRSLSETQRDHTNKIQRQIDQTRTVLMSRPQGFLGIRF